MDLKEELIAMFRTFVIIWLVSMLAFYTFDHNTVEVQTDEPIKIDFVFVAATPRPRPPLHKSLDAIKVDDIETQVGVPSKFARLAPIPGLSMMVSEL